MKSMVALLFVLLSLVFWGWVWGPVGMLLSVPLTMVVKLMLENTEDLQWVAVMLGDAGSADLSPSAGDRTHFSKKGARAIARLVVDQLAKVEPRLAARLKIGPHQPKKGS